MTIDELRALCLALPGTHEQETWGDAEHAGDVTFRVRDKIYLITGPDGGGASIRTDRDQQADLLAAFPDAVSSAPYVGPVRLGQRPPDALDPAIARGRHRLGAGGGPPRRPSSPRTTRPGDRDAR